MPDKPLQMPIRPQPSGREIVDYLNRALRCGAWFWRVDHWIRCCRILDRLDVWREFFGNSRESIATIYTGTVQGPPKGTTDSGLSSVWAPVA
jgi:hypothetical protein